MSWSGYDARFPPTMELQNIRRLAVFKIWNIGDVPPKINLSSAL
jgi:hypothetical protein